MSWTCANRGDSAEVIDEHVRGIEMWNSWRERRSDNGKKASSRADLRAWCRKSLTNSLLVCSGHLLVVLHTCIAVRMAGWSFGAQQPAPCDTWRVTQSGCREETNLESWQWACIWGERLSLRYSTVASSSSSIRIRSFTQLTPSPLTIRLFLALTPSTTTSTKSAQAPKWIQSSKRTSLTTSSGSDTKRNSLLITGSLNRVYLCPFHAVDPSSSL